MAGKRKLPIGRPQNTRRINSAKKTPLEQSQQFDPPPKIKNLPQGEQTKYVIELSEDAYQNRIKLAQTGVNTLEKDIWYKSFRSEKEPPPYGSISVPAAMQEVAYELIHLREIDPELDCPNGGNNPCGVLIDCPPLPVGNVTSPEPVCVPSDVSISGERKIQLAEPLMLYEQQIIQDCQEIKRIFLDNFDGEELDPLVWTPSSNALYDFQNVAGRAEGTTGYQTHDIANNNFTLRTKIKGFRAYPAIIVRFANPNDYYLIDFYGEKEAGPTKGLIMLWKVALDTASGAGIASMLAYWKGCLYTDELITVKVQDQFLGIWKTNQCVITHNMELTPLDGVRSKIGFGANLRLASNNRGVASFTEIEVTAFDYPEEENLPTELYRDDFDRPDGAVGGGWAQSTNAIPAQIVSSNLYFNTDYAPNFNASFYRYAPEKYGTWKIELAQTGTQTRIGFNSRADSNQHELELFKFNESTGTGDPIDPGSNPENYDPLFFVDFDDGTYQEPTVFDATSNASIFETDTQRWLRLDTGFALKATAANCWIDGTVDKSFGTGAGGIFFRRSDANNYFALLWDGGTNLTFRKVIAGAVSDETMTVGGGTTASLTVGLQGDAIVTRFGGQTAFRVRDSFNQTATAHGLISTSDFVLFSRIRITEQDDPNWTGQGSGGGEQNSCDPATWENPKLRVNFYRKGNPGGTTSSTLIGTAVVNDAPGYSIEIDLVDPSTLTNIEANIRVRINGNPLFTKRDLTLQNDKALRLYGRNGTVIESVSFTGIQKEPFDTFIQSPLNLRAAIDTYMLNHYTDYIPQRMIGFRAVIDFIALDESLVGGDLPNQSPNAEINNYLYVAVNGYTDFNLAEWTSVYNYQQGFDFYTFQASHRPLTEFQFGRGFGSIISPFQEPYLDASPVELSYQLTALKTQSTAMAEFTGCRNGIRIWLKEIWYRPKQECQRFNGQLEGVSFQLDNAVQAACWTAGFFTGSGYRQLYNVPIYSPECFTFNDVNRVQGSCTILFPDLVETPCPTYQIRLDVIVDGVVGGGQTFTITTCGGDFGFRYDVGLIAAQSGAAGRTISFNLYNPDTGQAFGREIELISLSARFVRCDDSPRGSVGIVPPVEGEDQFCYPNDQLANPIYQRDTFNWASVILPVVSNLLLAFEEDGIDLSGAARTFAPQDARTITGITFVMQFAHLETVIVPPPLDQFSFDTEYVAPQINGIAFPPANETPISITMDEGGDDIIVGGNFGEWSIAASAITVDWNGTDPLILKYAFPNTPVSPADQLRILKIWVKCVSYERSLPTTTPITTVPSEPFIPNQPPAIFIEVY